MLVGINILVAFTLDMYSSVERLDEGRMKTLKMLEKELKAPNIDFDIHEITTYGDKSRRSNASNSGINSASGFGIMDETGRSTEKSKKEVKIVDDRDRRDR